MRRVTVSILPRPSGYDRSVTRIVPRLSESSCDDRMDIRARSSLALAAFPVEAKTTVTRDGTTMTIHVPIEVQGIAGKRVLVREQGKEDQVRTTGHTCRPRAHANLERGLQRHQMGRLP